MTDVRAADRLRLTSAMLDRLAERWPAIGAAAFKFGDWDEGDVFVFAPTAKPVSGAEAREALIPSPGLPDGTIIEDHGLPLIWFEGDRP